MQAIAMDQVSEVGFGGAGLRNIHFADPPPERAAVPEPEAQVVLSAPAACRFRTVNRSPDEEFSARVAEHGRPKRFPQSVIALILQKQRSVEVTKNGLSFDYMKEKYTFWHENSPTCANRVGLKVLVTFDPDDMAFVHVLTPDGRYVESIPQKHRVAWFNDEGLREERRAQKAALARDLERFREIHLPTTEQKAARVKSNAEKMQIVNTFPAEGEEPRQAPAAFPIAEEIHGAVLALRGARAEVTTRREALRRFKPAELAEPEATGVWDESDSRLDSRPRFDAEKLLAK